MPFDGQAPNLLDVAKNVVIGQLNNIEKKKFTIAKPDGAEQSVAVDANTKFVDDHGDAITLAGYKTGDHVAATGILKDGVFFGGSSSENPGRFGTPPPPFPNRGSN